MVEDLKNVGSPDMDVKVSGRNIFVMLSPLPSSKRVLLYGKPSDVEKPKVL